jgi:hypothetical protein
MKKIVFIITGLLSWQVQSADLIFKHGFENTALVGGVVTGLTSTGLVLHLTASGNNENLAMDANGTFIFNQNVTIGTNWTVTIQTQPSNPTPQTCTLSNATGTMSATGVNNVQVSCSNTPNKWDVMKWDEGTWQ